MTHLSDALNGGLQPEGIYARTEQHAGQVIADVLTLQASPNAAYRASRKTLAIRHVGGHRLIA